MGTRQQTTSPFYRQAGCPYILFEHENGIYWLRGENLARAKKLLELSSERGAVGFDAETTRIYVDDLAKQGVTVGIIRGNTMRTISCQQTRKPEKVQSKTVWLASTLLFGQRELADINRHLNGNRFMVDGFIQRMRTELTHDEAIKELGTLFVYQVAEELYEVDWELTAIPRGTVEALTVAAHQIGQPLRCELVAPKSKRINGHRQLRKAVIAPTPQFVVSKPVVYGQMRFEI